MMISVTGPRTQDPGPNVSPQPDRRAGVERMTVRGARRACTEANPKVISGRRPERHGTAPARDGTGTGWDRRMRRARRAPAYYFWMLMDVPSGSRLMAVMAATGTRMHPWDTAPVLRVWK